MRKGGFAKVQIIKVLKDHAAVGERSVPEVRHQRCDVLQVAVALWLMETSDARKPKGLRGETANSKSSSHIDTEQ